MPQSKLYEEFPSGPNSLTLSWNDLNYDVTLSSWWSQARKAAPTRILTDVSGSISSGQFMALMGPSGCGKTTLMKSLLHGIRHDQHQFADGNILVSNGDSSRVRAKVALVPQNDALYEQFTPFETLMFVSQLINPLSTHHDHLVQVTAIIDQIGLKKVTHVKVGNLSGGERKRLSVGQELIRRPQILLLDEPTSGLDSTSCLQLVSILQRLAHECHMAVMASIHQPSSNVLNMFDNIYVLAFEGIPIYNGPSSQIMATLELHDYWPDIDTNPAEHLTEIAAKFHGDRLITRLKQSVLKSHQLNHSNDQVNHIQAIKNDSDQMRSLSSETWIIMKRSFQRNFRSLRFVMTQIFMFALFPYLLAQIGGDFQTQPCRDCYLLGLRSRNVSDLLLTLEDSDSQSDNRAILKMNMGLISFGFAGLAFYILESCCIKFPMERAIFFREHKNGWYSVTAYFIGWSVAESAIVILLCIEYAMVQSLASSQLQSLDQYLLFVSYNVAVGLITMIHAIALSSLVMGDYVRTLFLSTVYISLPVAVAFISCIRPARNFDKVTQMAQLVTATYYGQAGTLVLIYGADGRCSDIETICSPAPRRGGGSLIKHGILTIFKSMEQESGFLPEVACENGHLAANWSESWVINDQELQQWTASHSLAILSLITFVSIAFSYFIFKYDAEKREA